MVQATLSVEMKEVTSSPQGSALCGKPPVCVCVCARYLGLSINRYRIINENNRYVQVKTKQNMCQCPSGETGQGRMGAPGCHLPLTHGTSCDGHTHYTQSSFTGDQHCLGGTVQ